MHTLKGLDQYILIELSDSLILFSIKHFGRYINLVLGMFNCTVRAAQESSGKDVLGQGGSRDIMP